MGHVSYSKATHLVCLAYSIRNCSVHISDIAEYILNLNSLFDSVHIATMEVHDLQL